MLHHRKGNNFTVSSVYLHFIIFRYERKVMDMKVSKRKRLKKPDAFVFWSTKVLIFKDLLYVILLISITVCFYFVYRPFSVLCDFYNIKCCIIGKETILLCFLFICNLSFTVTKEVMDMKDSKHIYKKPDAFAIWSTKVLILRDLLYVIVLLSITVCFFPVHKPFSVLCYFLQY